jgi:RNA polymerase primary sigma factor
MKKNQYYKLPNSDFVATSLPLFKFLEPREQKILKMHYGLDGYTVHTLVEIGNEFNVSPSMIGKVEKVAINKLHNVDLF